MKVSPLGLGPMGAPVAANLVRGLGALTVWNRTPGKADEAVAGGLAGSTVLDQKRERWLRADFTAGGSARNQLKDLRFAREAANAAEAPSELTALLHDQFHRMVAAGDGELDHSGLLRTIAAGT